jgi:HTH-type transcriptional regulator, competence development regulator
MKMFGEYLRDLRETKNLPLRKVAAFLDIDTSILSKIERGEREANKEIVINAAKFFDVDEQLLVNEFYGDCIAKLLLQEDELSNIFKVAEKKIEYLKTNNVSQSKLKFDE